MNVVDSDNDTLMSVSDIGVTIPLGTPGNGRVGIRSFQIQSGSVSRDVFPIFTVTGSGFIGIGQVPTNLFQIAGLNHPICVDSIGYLGIGTEAPTSLFHLRGGDALFEASNGDTIASFRDNGIKFSLSDAGRVGIRSFQIQGGSQTRDVESFFTVANSGYVGIGMEPTNLFQIAGFAFPFIVDSLGFVGIGTNTPGSLFHLQGGDALFEASNGDTMAIFSDNSIKFSLSDHSRVGIRSFQIQGGSIGRESEPLFTVIGMGDYLGNVGIGILSPVEKLEVDGGIKVGNSYGTNPGTIRYTGQDFEGYLEESRGWVSFTSGGAGSDEDWGIDGDDMYAIPSGSVGIGTNTPGYKLDVDGDLNLNDSNDVIRNAGVTVFSVAGSQNLWVGSQAGAVNSSGMINTAIGVMALNSNTIGNNNTAAGNSALRYNTEGEFNTALGRSALLVNETGDNNTAVGGFALLYSYGDNNAAIGFQAGNNLMTGSNNTFIGHDADATVSSLQRSTAIGYNASVAINDAIVLGDPNNSDVKVGVGTASPLYKLHAIDTATNSDNPAVYGIHDVTDNYGVGVRGRGGYFGVYGESYSTGGSHRGVYGYAYRNSGGSGSSYGVYGQADGPLDSYGNLYGVYGNAYGGGDGSVYGVYGTTSNQSGYGLYGTTDGDYGTGVYGSASGYMGYGVYGSASGEFGYGVYGSAYGYMGYAGYFYGDVNVT
ncbi:MAG: hypothetical protein GY869_14345, partial [Planctomycetes bacterium]|nr:hypothetical protein [Planctomycetota bacterium]